MTAGRLGGRLWWGLIPLVCLLWGTAALSIGDFPGIDRPPLVTLISVPVADYLRTISLALAAGAVIALLISPSARSRRWALIWSLISLGLVGVNAVALQSDVAGGPLQGDSGTPFGVLIATRAGQAMVVQAVCLTLVLMLIAASARTPRRWPLWGGVVLLGVAIGAPSLAGHVGFSGDHLLTGVAVAVHAVAVSIWVGGLAVVSALALMEPSDAAMMLRRFSLLALICVIVLAETGLLSASLTVGSLGDLLGSTYGSVILGKAVLLAALIRLGWLQRRQAIDRLPDRSVPLTVARIAGIEFLVMGTAIAAAVVLTRIGPPPIPTPGFAPLTLVAIGIAGPLIMVAAWPRGWRFSDSLPEVSVVVLLLVMVEVGGVGLLRAVFGGVGLLLELMLLALIGWLAMSALRRTSARSAVIVAMVGLPVALGSAAWLQDWNGWRMSLVALVAGEFVLALWWRRLEQRTQADAAALTVSAR